MARWLAPLFILWPFVRPRLARDWPIIRAHWRIVGVLGLTGRTAFGVLQYVGLKYTTALNTSVLNSASPVMIVVVSALLFGDPLRVRQVLGISVSLFGVLVIVSRADVAVLSALQFNWGDLIILLNMAIFAFYSSVLRLRPNVHPLSFLFVFAAVSTIGTIPFLVAELLIVPAPALSWANFGFLLYVGIFPSLVSFIAWNRGVELIGPNRAGAFLHLVPFYSALMAVALLGESLEIFHFVGFALILGGEAKPPRARWDDQISRFDRVFAGLYERVNWIGKPLMKVRNSLKSLRGRHRANRLVRRKGRLYVINKVQKRFKARQG